MRLRKSGNEIDGMFVSYDTDNVKLFTRNNTMVHNTVTHSFPDEIVISTLEGKRTYTLTTAPTNEPTVCYRPHDGSTGKITFVKSGGISLL